MKIKSPFFTIVIPTYNRAEHISGTINSVLTQLFENFEVIVVDDGSSDNTEDVVGLIGDPRIHFFKKENGERAAARNYGIDRAKGEYVTFLDSDDIFRTNHLKKACEIIKTYAGIPIFHISYDIVDRYGNLLKRPRPLQNPVNKQLIEGNFLSCLGIFVSKEVLQDYRFNEDRGLSGSEDYELWLRIASRYDILTFPYYTSSVVQHDNRSVINVDPEQLLIRIEKLKKHLYETDRFMKKYNLVLNKFEAYLDIYLALHLIRHKKKSLKHLLRAIQYYPKVVFDKRFSAVIKNLLLE